MAINWFSRFEGVDLDGTHDRANGSADTTGTINGAASISATAARVGTNGLLVPASGANQLRYDTSTDMVSRLVGAIGGSLRVTTAPSGVQGILSVSGSAGNNMVFEIVAGELRVTTNLEGTGESSIITTAFAFGTAAWAGLLYRWDQPNSLRRIEVYNASNVLIDFVEDNSAFTAPADLVASDGLRFGNIDGNDAVYHMDNWFIANAYAEPIQNNFTIASYTNYNGGGGGGSIAAIASYYNRLRSGNG